MTSAMKNAMAPLGKKFFSSGDSMLVVFNVSGTNVSAGKPAGHDYCKGGDLIFVRLYSENSQ
jgi:hypothetical protein